ncbi:MAG: hypothetical protein WBD40_15755 [Tepidisphaeraceae bacterium]
MQQTPAGETPASPPPRAFAQGVGTVFQFAGVILFLTMSFVCCGSGLLSREWATQETFRTTGLRLEPRGEPAYSVARAITVCVFGGVFFGIALAALGLGLQAEHRAAARGAVAIGAIGVVFWLAHAAFALSYVGSALVILLLLGLSAMFVFLLTLAIGAAREMKANPPPSGHEILPADYKVPYSHYHVDPPEVRLAAELEQRRQRLAVQQKELEMLEEKLKRKLGRGPGD